MKDYKKVVLIGSAYPLRGGLASFNERIIREYQKQGYDAEIYTFSLQYPGMLFPGKTQYSTEPAPADLKISVKVNSINPFNWVKVGLELKRKRPDLIIVKFWIPFMAPCFGTIVRIAKSNKVTKVISIVDNIIPHEHRPGDRILSKYWVNSVDGFIAMSKIVLSDLRSFTESKPALVCPHPIYDNYGEWIPKQEALRRLNLTDDFKYILFFGFIRDYKGLDILINAFSNDRIRKMPLKLIVAGEFYCDSKPYFDLIEKLNLGDRIILSNDFIPESKVVNYFCAADLVVQPYKSATQSGVTQIAYNFNKPMIITKVGGLEEFVTNNVVGYVVPPEPGDVANAIVRFYDEDMEEQFISNVRREKQRFSWSNMINSIDRLINNTE
jgi:D-inositol-3-phosphate glycosyltransferase